MEELGTSCALAFIKSADVKGLHLLNVSLWKQKGVIKVVLFSFPFRVPKLYQKGLRGTISE